MKRFAILLFALVGMRSLFAQTPTPSDEQRDLRERKGVAIQALATLQELGRRTTFKEMGFETIQEMADAKLDEPFFVFMVELNDLRAYQAGSDPNKLLKPTDKVIYPVSANAQVRTSIILRKGKEGWKTSDMGGGNLARLASQARDASAKATNLALPDFFMVQIPALNTYFVGYRQETKLMLAPLIDDPNVNLKAGASLPAEQVFDQLHSLAEKHNGLPM